MDNAQSEIRNEIEATRAGMAEKIATLEDRVDCTIQGVKRSFDPRYQTEQHPWLAIGLSVAAGYWLSGLVLGRPTPKAELVLPNDWDERVAGKQRNSGMLQSLTGMLSGVVTATAVSMAREYASGLLFKRKHNGHGNGRDRDSTAGGGRDNYPD
ncbi:MAG: DUF3618 domain-containing protein [Candidatus Binatia bacterium]